MPKKNLNSHSEFDSPIARKIIAQGEPKKMNLVLVIMERMSGFYMGKYDGPKNITPVLDSLKNISLWFENIFTQGTHTFSGIYSTLFSYPTLLKKHSMANIPSEKYYSMPQVLKEQGYRNLFFISHDGQFDNVQGFLTANCFDKVYTHDNYPSEKILSTLGVPDDYLFEYSIPKMNEVVSEGKNFFCGFMTSSNHEPFIFPEWAKINFKSSEDKFKIVEYADWSIGKFMKLASEQSWYNNTIFVFVADHGMTPKWVYEMPITFHHTPLIIYSPGMNLQPAIYDCLGSQMDIFPTVMDLMNFSYVNNTMGIDLLKEKHPYIYFTADDKIGCLDKEFYFIHQNNGIETLYRYENMKTDNYIEQYKTKTESMKTYAYSMLQTTQWIINNKKFGKQKS
ncbi:MAG: LTA synthase family protein [Bacteroidota bacterium]